ncbi:efflux RND transporter permease subunit [Paenibacillus sp. OAS669]|uniref:efflux RND transporter permease subunit n=1 Tax=Paenibacillus sp. OAS669 TaxID=2663821 RepID=UPI00178A051C|nr:efflux RND transporter permease subunit [Paenibacillus sp. OAS669]MBE1440626.1 multidrug efflux pump subunit AcrB [Paenibacillus sp. OAS669]
MLRITQFSMKNLSAILIIAIMLTIGGMYSATLLKIESLPRMENSLVFIETAYPAPPEDVLKDVTKKLEEKVQGLDGLKKLSSVSSNNFSQITLELEDGVSAKEAKKEVESLIQSVKLPDDAEKPKVLNQGIVSVPVYYLSLYGKEDVSQAELSRLLDDVFLPGFRTIRGLDRIETIGNSEATVKIKLNADAINQFDMTPSQVAQYIEAWLISKPAGEVEFDGSSEMIRVKGGLNTLYALTLMKVTSPSGDLLNLNQIAKIEAIDDSKFISRLNGSPAIAVHLYKTDSANVVEFTKQADQLIKIWKQQYPALSFDIVINGAVEINNSVSGMLREGILGALLAAFIILVFLRNIRMTSIVLVSIPLSMLITFILMQVFDITLNIMTLGGMVIAIGRVVDDSIVVIENIYSQLQKKQEREDSVILFATKQVSAAITSSTITTVAVFLPLGLVSDPAGTILAQFALTVTCALMASLVVALSIIPLMAKVFVLRQKKLPVHEEKAGRFTAKYSRLLLWSLNHKVKTLTVAVILLVGSIGIAAPFVKIVFLPDSEIDKTVSFEIQAPHDTSLSAMDDRMKQLETMLIEVKDPKGEPVFSKIEVLIGFNWEEKDFPNRAVLIAVVNDSLPAREMMKQFQTKIQYELPADYKVYSRIISALGISPSNSYEYRLIGNNSANLREASEKISNAMRNNPDLSNVRDSFSDSKTELEVLVDLNKARIYGVTAAQVLQTVHSWIDEIEMKKIMFDNTEFQTYVGVDPLHVNDVRKLGELRIKTANGVTVELHDIAKIKRIASPTSIFRENQQQYAAVTATINGQDTGGISNKVTAELDALELPAGVVSKVQGASLDIAKPFGEMLGVMVASIFVIYVIMVLTFGNAGSPFAILFSLPFATIGGIGSLVIFDEPLGISSLFGFLMLIGIVVTNAIVLIDRVQQLQEEGMETRTALLEAGTTRLRPILMTAAATIISLLPLVLGHGGGAVISKGLALVVMGGLTTSTLLTLVVVPCMFEIVEHIKMRFTYRSNSSKGTESEIIAD